MKKLSYLLIAFAMFALVACNGAKKEAEEKRVADSIATVEAEAAAIEAAAIEAAAIEAAAIEAAAIEAAAEAAAVAEAAAKGKKK